MKLNFLTVTIIHSIHKKLACRLDSYTATEKHNDKWIFYCQRINLKMEENISVALLNNF